MGLVRDRSFLVGTTPSGMKLVAPPLEGGGALEWESAKVEGIRIER
jgi:hypothetical protein